MSTTAGTKNLLSATQSRLQNLQYEYVSGNLMEGLILKDARWELKNGTVITSDNLQIFSNPTCWREKKICIDNGEVDNLTISLPENKAPSNEIALKNLSLLLSIETSGIHVDELVVVHPTSEPIRFHNAEFSGSIDESYISLGHFQAEWNKFNLQGSGSLTMKDHYPVNLRGSATRPLSSNGAFSTGWVASGNLKSFKLQSDINKPFIAKLDGTISLLDRRRPADMTLQWKEIAMPFESERPQVVLRDGTINITGDWPAYDVRGSASISGQQLPPGQAVLSGILSTAKLDLNPLTIDTLDGHIISNGVFSWSDGMQWSLLYSAENINPGIKWKGIEGRINSTGGISGVAGSGIDSKNSYRFNDINIAGHINQQKLTAKGDFFKDASGWSINSFKLDGNKNHISAHGHTDDSIKLMFSIEALENLVPGAQGDVHGELTVSNEIEHPTLKGSVTTSNLHYKNINLKNARLSGIARKAGNDYSDIQFQSSSIAIDARKFTQTEINFHGTLTDHLLDIKGSSSPVESVALNIIGAVDEHQNWNGTINSADGYIIDRPIGLNKPFTAVWIHENKTLAVEPHCWQYDFASVCITESALLGQTGVVKFTLSQLPLESIAELLPVDLQLSGDLRSSGELLWGSGQKPAATVNSALQNASVKLKGKINNKQLNFDIPVATLNVETNGSKIESRLQMESDKFSKITADVDINTAADSYPINGKVSLTDTQLDWIKDFLPDINLLNGTLGGDARISGTLSNPIVNSRIRLKDGQVKSTLLPIDVNDIRIDVNVESNKASIKGHALANGSDLQINGSGGVTDKGFDATLRLAGSDIKFDHEYAEQVILSPNLEIRVAQDNINITGKVDIPRAKVTLKSLSTDGVMLSDDVTVTDEETTPTANAAVGSTGINTRVNVSLGEQVSVNGYGLNAELGGGFTFALASEKPPSLTGQIAVANGEYKAYGQNLKIRDGVINFTGPLEQTALSIEAIREIKEVLAGVRIKGTLQNPITNLFSEPPLPEEDILPYLVLGRSLDLNQGDASVLRKAALLLGVNTSQKMSSKLANRLGIDDFSLSAWGTGDDTQILVSGKINDRLLLRYGVGVFKNSNSFYLRYDLADKLYLETTQGLESAVDLYYTFDF